ncbi:MAG: hypothetical protein WB507_01415 [Solirubrobacterales bacterium]
MSSAAQLLRLALFCAACAALLAAAIGFADGSPANVSPPHEQGAAPAVTAAPQSVQTERVARLRATLHRAAGRFLAAFFHYEVGELGPGVRQQLRTTCSPAFAAELLGDPPRRPSGNPAAAAPGRLAISVASIEPPRALISGSASRGGATEQFSFLFEARHGVWLASGPGE